MLLAEQAQLVLVGNPELDVPCQRNSCRRCVPPEWNAEIAVLVPHQALFIRTPRRIARTDTTWIRFRQAYRATAFLAALRLRRTGGQQRALGVDASVADFVGPCAVGFSGGGSVDVGARVDLVGSLRDDPADIQIAQRRIHADDQS